MAFFWFCGNAVWEALPTAILPFLVARDVGSLREATALSLLSTLGTLLASAVHPFAGWASDASRSRYGRRRPFLLVGGGLSAGALAWMAFGGTFLALLAAVLLLQFGYNLALAAYQAYIPELAPAGARGKASGFLGLMSTLGALLGAIGAALLVRGTTYRWMLLFLAALLLFGIAVTVWGVPEPALPAVSDRPQRLATPSGPGPGVAGAPPAAKPSYRDFIWVAVTRGLVMLAFYSLLTYIAYYFKDVDHIVHYVTATSLVVAITIVAAASATLWAGRRSDTVGRRGIVAAAGGLMGLGAAAFLVLHSLVPTAAVGVVFGAGYGAYLSVDWALISDVLPQVGTIARDMGLWGLAITVPQVLAPVIGGTLFLLVPTPAVAYRLIFGLTAVFALVGSALVWQVRGVR